MISLFCFASLLYCGRLTQTSQPPHALSLLRCAVASLFFLTRWATYENTRGAAWYELLNPSEVFGDIMIDTPMSSALAPACAVCQTFMISFRPSSSGNQHCNRKGCRPSSPLRDDGSWYGSWACCFTYGTWFGVRPWFMGKVDPRKSKSVQKAVEFCCHIRMKTVVGEKTLPLIRQGLCTERS